MAQSDQVSSSGMPKGFWDSQILNKDMEQVPQKRAEVIKHPPRRTNSCYVEPATSDLNSGHFSQRPLKSICIYHIIYIDNNLSLSSVLLTISRTVFPS